MTHFPELGGDIRGSIAESLSHVENQQLWQSWLRYLPTVPLDQSPQPTVWLDTLDPYLKERAQRLLTYKEDPELPAFNRAYHAGDLATKIARELRNSVVVNRQNQIKAMYESVEDVTDRHALEQRAQALNWYRTAVTAPLRITIFRDLRVRLDQLK